MANSVREQIKMEIHPIFLETSKPDDTYRIPFKRKKRTKSYLVEIQYSFRNPSAKALYDDLQSLPSICPMHVRQGDSYPFLHSFALGSNKLRTNGKKAMPLSRNDILPYPKVS